MRPPRPVPADLHRRPFGRAEALALGVSARMLEHDRFVEVFPRVYIHVDETFSRADLTAEQWIQAARLSLPADAVLSHQTRLRELGLELGPLLPLHFTVGRDHHRAHPEIMLHRTEILPPHDDDGVCIEAAYLGVASTTRLLDVIKIGDWLLHRGHLDEGRLRRLIERDHWRPGVSMVKAALPHLEPRSRSLLESEGRVFLTFAGLPRMRSNLDIHDDHRLLGCADLALPELMLVVEIEGRQHALDMAQFHRDIDRYAGFRDAGWAYVQATARHLSHPKAYVLNVHRVMKSRGYEGPPPSFGDLWDTLFAWPRRHVPER